MSTITLISPAPATPADAPSNVTLRGYAVAGLLATLDAHQGGTLPAPRLSWELRGRIDQLADLGLPAGLATRLRWLAHGVEHHQAAPGGGRVDPGSAARSTPDDAGRAELDAALGVLRTFLERLTPATGSAVGHGPAARAATAAPDGPLPRGQSPRPAA